ncbi:MAG: hypothetical protein LBQ66_08825 [Planctomycetaceae bacterium]|jgi:hypothetical protein|nr:hypothetical protein [Planctomycetaceae bacterium]
MRTEIVEAKVDKSRSIVPPSDEQLCESTMQEVDTIAQLLSLVEGLPESYRVEFYSVIGKIVDGMERRQIILGKLHESLSQMSLDLKYLVFDLEATRRERDECLKIVNNSW